MHVGLDKHLGRLAAALGRRLGNQMGFIVRSANYVHDLGVGNARILQHVQILEIAWFRREADLAAALGVTVSLVQK